ncbi:hypothetical protein [Demequina sp. NBRC 110054]|uniref:hypothetical protein n=1 Tax=Demequina sp. NBRC 110054 TaxID=1570343 RepID=UPI0009FE9C19|nr:hypothetical protein [Demequina sp. NBRC 110054]
MPTIKALRTEIADGAKKYPIYLGFLSAAELEPIAAVPSFTVQSENYRIADNILGDPVKDWQRPPIKDKIEKIKDKFSQTSELMPNPVLLAVSEQESVVVTQQNLNGQNTEVFEIAVAVPSGSGPKPLWILDGQHRVLGLSKSSRSSNPVPLVLLHGDALNAYAPKQFAKIFAEVTTLATPLQHVHSEWLQFAFKLGPYETDTTADWKAMKAVADLCRTQQFGDPPVVNPFFDTIEFNPELGGKPAIHSGFQFNCIELKDLVRAHYYGRPAAGTTLLTPTELAEQLALSLLALGRADTSSNDKSAFFGGSKARQKYMEEGYVTGVLTYLREKGTPPTGWDDLLSKLGFTTANWDFTGWVVTTGGNTGTLSKNVAQGTFKQVFAAGALPEGVADIPTFLRGDKASISFTASNLTPKGRPAKPGRQEHSLDVTGGVKKIDLGSRRHLKLSAQTVNVGQVDTRDSRDMFSDQYSPKALKRGITLPDGPGRIELKIQASLYGGVKGSPLTLEITWT